MSTNKLTPRMVRRELAHMLWRSVFEGLDEAEHHTAADHGVGGEILVKACMGALEVVLRIPSDELSCSLDHISDKYLRHGAQQFIEMVWRGEFA